MQHFEFDIYSLSILVVFFLGYLAIIFEGVIGVNKATSALLMGIITWVIEFANGRLSKDVHHTLFGEHLSNITQVVLFLIGALIIVEIINAHDGFHVISDRLRIRSKRAMLWVLGVMTFFLSSVLDNVTTTIVMVALLSRMTTKNDDRWILGAAVVLAANAGGVWSPIGDVTTTMLWIGGQVSTFGIVQALFFPSLIALIVALGILNFQLKGDFPFYRTSTDLSPREPLGPWIFALGCLSLIFVPIFKVLTGLPPFMGILLGLSFMWLVTDLLHHQIEDKQHLRVTHILSKVDYSGAIFFLGILLTIDAMSTAGILKQIALYLNETLPSPAWIAFIIGGVSAIIDNVPLVAATINMYDLKEFPMDHNLWEMLAYAAGIGGSLLIIGSAAGVAFMGMEGVGVWWYCRKISIAALFSYVAGFIAYLVL